mgnify:CR=1 FL=1
MRQYSVIGGILLVVVLLSSAIPERIEWRADQKIAWHMFKAVPNTTNGYAATSSTGISQSYQINSNGYIDKPTIRVKAHFYPKYSWYNAKDTSAYLLAHEQAHFDITEIHARKLRKRITEFDFSANSKTEIKALYNEIEQERKLMQRHFDSASRHSRDRTQEMRWRKEIKRLLEKYWVYTP